MLDKRVTVSSTTDDVDNPFIVSLAPGNIVTDPESGQQHFVRRMVVGDRIWGSTPWGMSIGTVVQVYEATPHVQANAAVHYDLDDDPDRTFTIFLDGFAWNNNLRRWEED